MQINRIRISIDLFEYIDASPVVEIEADSGNDSTARYIHINGKLNPESREMAMSVLDTVNSLIESMPKYDISGQAVRDS